MTRLVLIRHGMTSWNREMRYCGSKDIGLSDEGRAQIESLSNALKTFRFDKVYSSDLKRAMQSARILFRRSRIIRDPALREIDFGIFEGLRREEIMEAHAVIYKRWLKDAFKSNIPGAEPMAAFKKRAETAIRRIARSNRGKTVAIVCHGGVIGMILKSVLRNRNFWRCIPAPASVTIIDYDGGRFKAK